MLDIRFTKMNQVYSTRLYMIDVAQTANLLYRYEQVLYREFMHFSFKVIAANLPGQNTVYQKQ